MRRRAFVPVLLAGLMAIAVAAPVHAAEPTYIDVVSCDQEGEVRVGRRSPTTLTYFWLTDARRQMVKFLDRSYVELTIDGSPVANADLLWTRPIEIDLGPETYWASIWEYDLGRLGPGNSIDVTFDLTFTQSHWDGFANYPPGKYEDRECTVFTRA